MERFESARPISRKFYEAYFMRFVMPLRFNMHGQGAVATHRGRSPRRSHWRQGCFVPRRHHITISRIEAPAIGLRRGAGSSFASGTENKNLHTSNNFVLIISIKHFLVKLLILNNGFKNFFFLILMLFTHLLLFLVVQ